MTPSEFTSGLQWRALNRTDGQECNYVRSSWLRSYAEGPEFRSMPRAVFFALYRPVVERLLALSTVIVAFREDLPDTVIGFLVTEGDDVVHYVHTKRRFRNCGVGRWMTRDLAKLPATFTHHPTPFASRLCGPEWKLDPLRRFEDRKAAA